MDDTQRAQRFWDREVSAPTHSSWLEQPRVRDYVNRLIGGEQPCWPLDWFERMLSGRRFRRGLSIGCGTGALERDLVGRGLVENVDAFDGSLASLSVATRLAAEAGAGHRVRYFAGDFNRIDLPAATYDVVFFHQSLHHVAKLERLLRQVMRALEPDGVVYLDEYFGPSSTWWNDKLAARHHAAWNEVPAGLRRVDILPFPIAPDDPSEAIRSGEILGQLAIGFDLQAVRPYGGNVLSAIYPHVDWERAPQSLLDQLIRRDAEAMAAGESPYYGLVIATPRKGLAKRVADGRFYATPKLKRIGREVRKVFR